MDDLLTSCSLTHRLLGSWQQTLVVGHTGGTLGRHQQAASSEMFLHYPVNSELKVRFSRGHCGFDTSGTNPL